MMHTTCLNSAVSLKCKASRSSYFNDPTYFFDARFETNPLIISSTFSSSCCCCCSCCCAANNNNSLYNSSPRVNPSFLCNGLRQSTLIKFSPSRRLISHGRMRQSCNNTSDRNYYYEKLYSIKEKRKLGKSRYMCWGIEDKRREQFISNEIDDDYVEILLDLMTEEVGLENVGVKERKRTEKKEPRNVTNKTKTVCSGSVKRDLKCDNKAIEDRRLRNEKSKEESKTFVKGVNHERKKKGSSCSSYYSVSSTGEYESDNDVEIKHDDCFVRGESSSEHKDDQKIDSYRRSYDEEVQENVDRRREFGKEQSEILKKNSTETYYGNQEWRKNSEKKLNVDSSQHQSHVSVKTEQNNQQHNEKADRMKYKRRTETSGTDNGVTESSSNTQKRYSDTENNLITSVQEIGETSDRVTRQDEYKRQSNVISEMSRIHEIDKREASSSSSLEARIKNRDEYKRQSNVVSEMFRIHEIDKRDTSSSSSSLEARIKNREDYTTEISDQVQDRREEHHQRIDQLTTINESRVKSQQISDTRITNTENTSVSQRQSDIRREKQELHLETSSSKEKVTIDQQVALRRKSIEDKYSSSGVKMVEGTTESMKTGRKTTKASSFHVGVPKEASSSYKALKLNPVPNIQKIDARGVGTTTSGSLPIVTASSAGDIQEPLGFISHEDSIASADEQHKSSSHLVGEFVKKAKHELSISEVELVDEDGSGNSDRKDGPSDEMWHETGAPIQQPLETDAPDNTSSSGNGESVKRSGRSLWNVIGDVVRMRWASSRSETNTPKSSGGKVSSNRSTTSETWFSGHEHEDSNDEIVKSGSTKGRSRSQKDGSNPSSSKEKVQHQELDSLLLLSSSSNTNQGSSSKTMSPLPAIRMRRSPVVERTDASGSGKMVNTWEPIDTPLTETSPTDASGSGKMVILNQPVPARVTKLARIDQVSKDRFDEWEEAYTHETNQRKNDEIFMREALLEAKKAGDLWEVPVGAVLVHDGKVIARGYNLVEELRDSTAHAEMICIREASHNLRSWRLSGTTLYVTLEPCPMCAGAILQARIDTIVWGAPNKLLGADGSWIRLFPDGDGGNGSDKPPAPVHPFHPNMTVRRGVLSAECADVMQQFFQLRRRKKVKKTEDEPPTPPPPSSCLPVTHHHNSKFFSKMHDAFSIMFCL